MGQKGYKNFVKHELDSLSETIVSMHDFYTDLQNNTYTRLGVYNYYRDLMQKSNDIIKILNRNWQYVPEDMAATVSSAISYTKSVQGELYREMISSPCVHWGIANYTSRNRALDEKIYSCICHLEKAHIYTVAMQKAQDVRHVDYNTEQIPDLLYDASTSIAKAADLQSNHISVMIENIHTHSDGRFLQHMQTIIEKTITPFLIVINKHMHMTYHSMDRIVQQAQTHTGISMDHSTITNYYETAMDMSEIIERDIHCLLGSETGGIIDEQKRLCNSWIQKIEKIMHYYTITYKEIFIPHTSDAQYTRSQATRNV